MTLKIGHFQVLKIRLSKRGQVQNLSCKNEFCLHENKKRFPINDSTLSLPLKQRLMANRKWSIKRKKKRVIMWHGRRSASSTSFNCGCHLIGHNAIYCVFICPCQFYVYWFAYQSLSKTKWSIVLMKIFQNQKSKHNLTVQFRHFLIGKFWQEILNQRWSTALT